MEFSCNKIRQVAENDGNVYSKFEKKNRISIFNFSATSCPTVFVIRNIQVYFDQCSTCAGARNLAIRRSLVNITAFQQSLSLSTSSGNSSQVTAEICSTPNITRLSKIDIIYAFNLNILFFPVSCTCNIKYFTSTTNRFQSYINYDICHNDEYSSQLFDSTSNSFIKYIYISKCFDAENNNNTINYNNYYCNIN